MRDTNQFINSNWIFYKKLIWCSIYTFHCFFNNDYYFRNHSFTYLLRTKMWLVAQVTIISITIKPDKSKENNSSMKKNKLNLADLNLPSCFTSLKRLSPFMLATFFVVNVVLSIKLSKLINKSHGNGLCFKREITTCSPKKSIWSNTTYTWPIFQGDV